MTLTASNGRKIKTRALVDTGNTVTDRSVITKHLHNKLQAGFPKIGGNKINTAKTGSGLRRVGKSKRIKMKINKMSFLFKCF